jgi:hypothetical protein
LYTKLLEYFVSTDSLMGVMTLYKNLLLFLDFRVISPVFITLYTKLIVVVTSDTADKVSRHLTVTCISKTKRFSAPPYLRYLFFFFPVLAAKMYLFDSA